MATGGRNEERFTLPKSGITLCVSQGDIIETSAGCVVTGENKSISGLGLVSRRLEQKCPKVYMKVRDNMKNCLKKIEFCQVYSCSFPLEKKHNTVSFDTVLHAVVPSAVVITKEKEWKAKMKTLYENVLKAADKGRKSSVALPVLGTGGAGGSVEAATEVLAEALLGFTHDPNNGTWQMLTDIIVYTRPDTHTQLLKYLRRKLSNGASGPINGVVFHTNGEKAKTWLASKQRGNKPRGAAANPASKSQSTDSLLDDLTSRMSQMQVKGTEASNGCREDDRGGKEIADPSTEGEGACDERQGEDGKASGMHDKVRRERVVNQVGDKVWCDKLKEEKDDDSGDSDLTDSDIDMMEDYYAAGEDFSDDDTDVKEEKPLPLLLPLPVDVENEKDNCAICLDDFEDPKKLEKCGHTFCRACIESSFANHKPACPTCNTLYGVFQGNQPPGTMTVIRSYRRLPGYHQYGTLVIDYTFPNGCQGPNHPNPGRGYYGTYRRAFLPDSPEGVKVCRLLRIAFENKLTFTVGTSRTTGADNVVTWNDIHHKTNMEGGTVNFGYPDPTYLSRVTQELAARGVTEDCLVGRTFDV